jgi:hypothetical protein
LPPLLLPVKSCKRGRRLEELVVVGGCGATGRGAGEVVDVCGVRKLRADAVVEAEGIIKSKESGVTNVRKAIRGLEVRHTSWSLTIVR